MLREIKPGKRGGEFELIFGGTVTIESGTFTKKDVVTCCMVSPSNRHKYLPPLDNDEKLLSEIFIFSTSTGTRPTKKAIKLSLPYRSHNTEMFCTKLLVKPTTTDEWTVVEHTLLDSPQQFCLLAGSAGVYVLVSTPRREHFTIPTSGCIHTSDMNHLISVRIPKRATDVDIPCALTMMPLYRHNLQDIRKDYPNDMRDLVFASDFYDFKPNIQREYKRAVTIKLPLPEFTGEAFDMEDLCIMQKHLDGEWELLDVPVKIVKNYVSFDSKVLCRFCIAVAKPQRKKRLKEAMKHIEAEHQFVRGDILAFLHVQDKTWTLWFDCVPTSGVDSCTSDRLQQNFRPIRPKEVVPEPEEEKPVFTSKRNWRASRPKETPEKAPRTDLDLSDDIVYELEIDGGIEILSDDASQGYMKVHYCSLLKDSYRKFNVRPIETEEKDAISTSIKCYRLLEEGRRSLVKTYDLQIGKLDVDAYFYVEPEPEPVEEVPVVEEKENIVIEQPVYKIPEPPKPKPKRSNPATFARLTQLNRAPNKVFKESRVLTGRSLKTLAREIEQGLTLAIHLDMTDSAITGMGFDALANGLSLADITYRILLLWKRRTNRYKEHQVDMLCDALREMKLGDVAGVVLSKHQENQELVPGCFSVVPTSKTLPMVGSNTRSGTSIVSNSTVGAPANTPVPTVIIGGAL